jgi:hypothetical protein
MKTNEELSEEMLALPAQMHAFATQLNLLQREALVLNEKIEDANAEAFLHVSALTNPETGKPVHTNAEQRQNAAKKALSEDEGYRVVRSQQKELREKIEDASADLDLLRNRFSAVKTYIRALPNLHALREKPE